MELEHYGVNATRYYNYCMSQLDYYKPGYYADADDDDDDDDYDVVDFDMTS